MLRAVIPIEAATPLHLQRCAPSKPCPQSQHCARHDPALCDRRSPVDATVLRNPTGPGCPTFIDARGPVSNPVPRREAA